MPPVEQVAVAPAPSGPDEAAAEPAPAPTRPLAPAAPTRSQRRPPVPRAMWAITALHVLLLLCYSVIVPIFRAPDEYAHVDLARHLARTGTYPDYDELFVSAPIFAARDTSPAYDAGGRPVGTADAVPPDARPSFEETGPDRPSEAANQMPQHPPLYYGLSAALLSLADAAFPAWPWSFDRTVGLLRLLDVALVAGLPALAWATARRLGCPIRTSLTAAVLMLAIPQFTHIGSVVTNDALLVVLSAVLFLLAARIVSGDLSRRTAILTGIVIGLALLTKAFALILAPWILGAYLLSPGAPDRRDVRAGRLAWVAGLGTVIGGWWWVRNVVVHGSLQPGLRLRDAATETVTPDAGFFLSSFADRLFGSFWGNFGWFEVALSGVAVAVATLVVAGGVTVAFVRGRVGAVRARLAYFLFPAAALLVVVAVNSYRAYLKTGTPFVSQGRYLFPALVGLVMVAAVGFDQVTSRRTPALPLLAFAGAVAMHVLAIGAIMGRYWIGGASLEGLRSMLAFSPWPPVAVFVVGVVTIGVAGWVARELLRCWGEERRGATASLR